ncbi:MAG: hypothetical protein KJ548_03435, partial [Actinobacteria bacterium]|nr:hypothetical protein [Actinomycetota bacterium]
DGASTLAYAPVAVTGFAIAFVIDDPVTGKQATSLNLSPRLIAKLMTGSYAGSPDVGRARSDLADNPLSLQLDPEFQQLNPELSTAAAGSTWWSFKASLATLLSVSVKSDMMEALTSYLAADAEAMAFIAGEPDPWGMTVNEAYKDIELPRRSWPLEDDWKLAASAGSCEAEQPIAWFTKLMAPVSDVHKVAEDLLMAKPESTLNREFIQGSKVCKTVRSAQSIGNRTMLGLVTLSDAARYGLPTASLRTAVTEDGATFVAPTTSSLQAAVAAMTSSAAGEPYLPDAAALHESTTAYPGTMVLHAAFPLTGLSATTAEDAASFVTIATTEGQVEGQGMGELPKGYAPLAATGATAGLFAAAQEVATAVARQSGSMAAPASTSTGTAAGTTAGTTAAAPSGGSAVGSQVLAAPQATAVPGLAAPTAAATAAATTTPTPDAAVSGPLRAALPAGLAAAALAGVAVPFVRRTPRERP